MLDKNVICLLILVSNTQGLCPEKVWSSSSADSELRTTGMRIKLTLEL